MWRGCSAAVETTDRVGRDTSRGIDVYHCAMGRRGSIIRIALQFLRKARRRHGRHRGHDHERLYSRRPKKGTLPGPRVTPMNMDSVRDVARRYDIDLRGVQIRIRMHHTNYFGVTDSRGRVHLARDAFANEEELARTLFHERYHVEQLRRGMRYPTNDAEDAVFERPAYEAEERWWNSHRLNPRNRQAGEGS
jgi:hypothetical protein